MAAPAIANSHLKGKKTSAPDDRKIVAVLDVEKVTISSPQSGIKSFDLNQPHKRVKCDVLIAGGGVGGVAAAIRLSTRYPHLKICLTEETDWLGGQMTAQGVSAFDENYLIETAGACRSYQNFRRSIRAIYESYKLSSIGKAQPYLNPGTSWVTYLAFEPKYALRVLEETLNPAISSGALRIFPRTKAVEVNKRGGEVLTANLDDGEVTSFEPRICLDATELGDLLPLASLPYRVGSDSKADTGEKHAPIDGNKENVQDFVFPFVIDLKPGTTNVITQPPHFEEFESEKKFSFNDFKMFEVSSLKNDGNRKVQPFWTYRRLIARENFDDPLYPFDVAMINWDSNDIRGQNIIDQKPALQTDRLALAKSLSLGFLYWLQTKAPRDEGGTGYPELELRTDVLGTSDGLSKFPYIREARRIIPIKTIVEQDIVASTNPDARARQMPDTLGIGLYPVDIHGWQEVRGAGQETKPFQIPLSALIPLSGGKLLPACKNIGVTHITNGAYRLHPVEWAIGEAQGEVAAYSLRHHLKPAEILSNSKHLFALQRNLIEAGSPLVWFDDVSTADPAFTAIQYCVLRGVLQTEPNNLHFNPSTAVVLEDVLRSLAILFDWEASVKGSRKEASTTSSTNSRNSTSESNTEVVAQVDSRLTTSLDELLLIAQKKGFFRALSISEIKSGGTESKLTPSQLNDLAKKSKISLPEDIKNAGLGTQINRGQFARWLYEAILRKEKT
jgi:hypothetical protein